MIWQLDICFKRSARAGIQAPAELLRYRAATRGNVQCGWFSHALVSKLFLPFAVFLLLAATSLASTVSGRLELVSSHDPNVRKHTDYSGVVVWLARSHPRC